MYVDILLNAIANIAIITLVSYLFIKLIPKKRVYILTNKQKAIIILLSCLTTFILMSFSVNLPLGVKIDMRFNVLILLLYYLGPSIYVPATLLTAILRLSWGLNEAAVNTFMLYLLLGILLPFFNKYLSKHLKSHSTVLVLNMVYILSHSLILLTLYQDIYQFFLIGSFNFLFSSACLIIVMFFIEDMLSSIHLYLIERERAKSDFLTGLYNKREFSRRWEKIEYNQEIYQTAFLMLDIDHFKCINDQYGHANGDLVLQQIAEVLHTQHFDFHDVYRVGGEEFCVVLTNVTCADQQKVAEEIRHSIEQKSFKLENHQTIHLTVSIGLASLIDEKDMKKLYRLADKALYQAKERGRNRVVVLGEMRA